MCGSRVGMGAPLVRVAWAVVACMFVVSTVGQTAYFSTQGEITAASGEHDFFVTLDRNVGSADALAFFTQTHQGGTNSAGDAVPATGFDAVLDFENTFSPGQGGTNDDGGPGNDAFLSWPSAGATGGTLSPDPLDSGSYRLNLVGFSGAAGSWSVDLVGPTDALVFNAAAGTDSRLDSLKFGTETPSATPARLDYSSGSTMTVSGELGVAPTGSARLVQTSGTITAVGSLEVGAGGTVDLTGGTLNLGNNLSSVFGTLSVDGGNLVLAGIGNLRVNSGGELNVNSGMFDAGVANLSIDGGSTANLHFTNATIDLGLNRSHLVSNTATLNTFGSFDLTDSTDLTVSAGGELNAETLRVGLNDLGSFDDTQLTVTNNGSSLVATSDTFVGDEGGTGILTVRDRATADFGTLVIAGAEANNTVGTVNLESAATATAGFIFIADLGTNATGRLDLTGTGTTLTQSSGTGVFVGQNPASPTDTGTGTLDVGLGATFNTGTGTSRVDSTGTVDIDGTLNLNGDLTIQGGTVRRVAGTGRINLAADKAVTVSDGGTLRYGRSGVPGLLDAPGKSILVTGADSLYDGQQIISIEGGELRATDGGRVTADLLRMAAGTLVLDGTGATLETLGPATTTRNTIGFSRDDDATPAGTATFRLEGDAQATLAQATYIGSDPTFSGGTGRLEVDDNARVDAGSLFVGTNRGSGAVSVQGGVTSNIGRLVQAGASSLQVGSTASAGDGIVSVGFNGEFTTGTGAIEVFSNGEIEVGQGTFHARGDLTVNGGILRRTSETFGGFALAAGKDLTVRNGGAITFMDSLALPDGSQFKIQAGSSGLLYALNAGVGGGETATVQVAGLDASLVLNNLSSTNPAPSRLGADGGSATLTVNDGARVEAVSTVAFGAGTTAGAGATVNVQGGGELQLSSFDLGADGSTGGVSTLTVSGTNSQLTQRLGAFSTINLGHASQGSATLTVENGAEYLGGERIVFPQNTLNINATGTVNVNGKRFVADTINLNGGTFNFTNGTLDFDTFNGNLTQDGGALTPNTFDRAMTINGDYELDTGTVAFDIRRDADNSISADNIDLGTQGQLEVTATVFQSSPFNLGDTFTILSSVTPIVGTFASEDVVIFNDKTFDVIYNPTSVVLEVIAATSLIGDYNADGFVSQADLDLVLLNWGNTIVPTDWLNTNQFDGVQVSQNELDGVLLNWGNGTPPVLPTVSAVPEPAAGAVVALGGMAMSARRRRA